MQNQQVSSIYNRTNDRSLRAMTKTNQRRICAVLNDNILESVLKIYNLNEKKIKHTHTNGEKNEMRWIHIHQSYECQCACVCEKNADRTRETERVREGEKAHKCVIEGVLWWSLAICRFATKFSNHCFNLTWRVTSYIERCMYECVRDCILLFSHPFQFEILYCHIALFWHIV